MTYRSSPTKSARRSKADIAAIKDALLVLIEAERPMTVRQVFYRAVSMGIVGKTEGEYKQTVCRLLSEMRRDGVLPYGWIADGTRWMRKPNTHSSLAAKLDEDARTYRRAVWDNQPSYVEVWVEKEAITGVIYEVTHDWDVPLMPTRGYPSLSFLHSAGEAIAEQKRPVYLYYLGDHDPSGVDIPRKVERDLRAFAPKAELHFQRIAVNLDQIEEFNLTTRPTKKTDSRSKTFEGESVEVDAIPPDELRRIVREHIEQHVDAHALEQLQKIEQAERETMAMIARTQRRAS